MRTAIRATRPRARRSWSTGRARARWGGSRWTCWPWTSRRSPRRAWARPPSCGARASPWTRSRWPPEPWAMSSSAPWPRASRCARRTNDARGGGLMAKPKTVYTCTECGGQAPKWQGQCAHCNAWNTLVETVLEGARAPGAHRFASLAGGGEVVTLGAVEARDFPRLPTLIGEFDRVLGGGLVEGGVVLIGGDPGIGKSTLLLQAAARLSEQVPVLYVTGEESAQQVALRARRLGVNASKVQLLP